jgi:glutamate/tyrosine decarboxylase-like PLP-dependent enzyme
MTFPLEPSADQMQEMGQAALDFIASFVDDLEARPANGQGADPQLREALLRAPEDSASDFGVLLELFRTAASLAVETAGPRFVAYIPGGGLFASALAEFIARSVNRFTGHPDMAPELVAMEHGVLRWLCREFDLPDTAGGVITTGGSMATLSAIVAARFQRLGEDFANGTLYITKYSHDCVRKAARIAGFRADRVRLVRTTQDLRMDIDDAMRMIAQDRATGLKPFFLVANAGTTHTGTIDAIEDMAALAAREGLWFHVDGAYGGFFQLTDRGRAKLDGIESADSIVLDPHKGLFLPYGTGILLVRDTAPLRAAHTVTGDYLQDLGSDHGLPDFSELGPELTREFRGLRLWLPLSLHGVGAFRDALDEKLDLAAYAYDVLRQVDDLELPWKPDLSVVAFRLRDGDNSANLSLRDRINATNKVFLSTTSIDERVTLRLCILSHRTHHEHIEQMADVINLAVQQR